jgi:hypothetical protein
LRSLPSLRPSRYAILIRHTCAGSLPGPGAVRPASQ